jgi:hypothetical protein
VRPRPAPARRAAARTVATCLAAVAAVVGAVQFAGALAGAGVEPTGAAAFEATWRDADGTARALYRPRFVPAGLLLADAQAFGLAPLDLALDGRRGRILVSGAADRLAIAADAFGYLDVPTPQVLVEVSLVETLSRCRNDHGGHLSFDRGPDGPDTFFRAFRADFEPSAWLRSELVGGLPFQGVDVRGGGTDLSDGLRARSTRCCAARPRRRGRRARAPLPRLHRGRPGQGVVDALAARVAVLPGRGGRDAAAGGRSRRHLARGHRRGRRRDAVRSGSTCGSAGSRSLSPTGPESYPVLGIREATTTVRVADGETSSSRRSRGGGSSATDAATRRSTTCPRSTPSSRPTRPSATSRTST